MRRDRDEILKAAARYFSNGGGFRTTSMQEMAEAIDVSRSALYYHFTDKSDLLYEILMLVIDEFCNRAREIVDYPLPAAQRLALLVRAALKLEVENPGVPLVIVLRSDADSIKPEQRAAYIERRDEYEGYYRSLIDDGVAAGEFRPVNTKITTFALLGMLEEFDGWFDPDGPLSSDEIAEIFTDLVLASLAPDRPAGPKSEPAAPARAIRAAKRRTGSR